MVDVNIEDVAGMVVMVLILSSMIGPLSSGVDNIVVNTAGVSAYIAKILLPALLIGVITTYVGG